MYYINSGEYEKTCPVCGANNEMANKSCIKCGSYILDGVTSAIINITNESIERVKRLNNAPNVKCPTCGAPNKGSAKRCVKCNAWLLDEYWQAHLVDGGQRPSSFRNEYFWWVVVGLIILTFVLVVQ